MNKQPFYHRLEILFTATADVSGKANSKEFRNSFTKFLRTQFGTKLIGKTVTFEVPCDAEAGDPADLLE
jgi:hypothetical protein